MNAISIVNVTTMSSREIAELTGKRHDNVMADIRKMLAEIHSPEKSGQYKDTTGRTLPMLMLDKDETMCLISGYSAIMRMAIIKRWQELESAGKPSVPRTYAEALLEAGRLAMELEQKDEQLRIQAPKVDFADRVAGADKGVVLGNFARSVGIGQNTLFKHLRSMRVLMDGGNRHNLPLQEYIDRGYFSVRESTYDTNGETRLSFTPLITGKGQQWLSAKLLSSGVLRAVAAGGEQ